MYVNGVYVYDSFEFTQFGKASVPALETITTEWEYTLNVQFKKKEEKGVK